MKLEKLGKNNLIEIAQLYMEVFNSKPWNEKWSLETAVKRIETFNLETNKYGLGYCIRENNKVIGFIGGLNYFYDQISMFTIEEMCIANEYQKKGIGGNLLFKFEKIIKNKGFNRIELKTLKSSYIEKFYRDRGFFDNDNNRIYLAKNI